jgi:hypothetical protein
MMKLENVHGLIWFTLFFFGKWSGNFFVVSVSVGMTTREVMPETC